MKDFIFYNPVKVIFGSNSLDQLKEQLPEDSKIMLVYGGGSIKKNGVYDKVKAALLGVDHIEFGGITPNPEYATCMEAVKIAKEEKVTFFLSVGGGSVLDGVKFISAALKYKGDDPWEILSKSAPVTDALPIGAVLTIPATGSEVNGNSVVSRREIGEKLAFSSPLVMPKFSIMDPSVTLSLPWRQTANGIVDAFVHVMEQYLTYDVNSPLQDRQSEAILLTLIEVADVLKKDPRDLAGRANLMWAASNALNGLINCGVVQDWSTHVIGHEITALHGLDHAQTLAIILPALMENQKKHKGAKIVQYGKRVWNLSGSDDEIITGAISKTKEFFEFAGNPTTLSAYKLTVEDCLPAAQKLKDKGWMIGEHEAIGYDEIKSILNIAK
jgi:NADP-dependent alcohol dehydrogenase